MEQNSTFLNTTEQVDDELSSPGVKICHPQQDPWCHPGIGLLRDSSRVLYLSLLAVSATVWLAFFVRFCLDQLPNIPPLKKWGSGPLLPVLLAKDCDKNWFKNLANLSTTTMILVAMLICFHSDGQDLKLEPARPFLDFDDGFRFLSPLLGSLLSRRLHQRGGHQEEELVQLVTTNRSKRCLPDGFLPISHRGSSKVVPPHKR